MSTIKSKVIKRLEFDQAVLFILMNKVWSVAKGPISLLFIITFLTAEQQGIWYSFISLGALSIFAELGFMTIITQFVSHEYSHLRLKDGYIIGEKYSVDRLFSLVKYAMKFYIVIVPIAIIILIIVGFVFFDKQSVEILIAWGIFSVVGGLSLISSLLQSIYQGLDKVAEIQKNILFGSFIIPILNWLMLFSGFGIWALVIGNAFGVCLMLMFLWKKSSLFWVQLKRHNEKYQFSWFKEIISLQWRYAISWASGYFIFHLFVPATLKTDGAVVSGQVGITFAMMGGIIGLATSWLDSKIPKLNILVAKGERKLLWNTFIKSSVLGYLLFILGCSVFIIVLYLIRDLPYANRFLSVKLVFLIVLFELANLNVTFMARYLRAHKIEPFYWVSIITGLLIFLAIFFVLPQHGLYGLFISMNLIYWIVILPISIGILVYFKNKFDNELV